MSTSAYNADDGADINYNTPSNESTIAPSSPLVSGASSNNSSADNLIGNTMPNSGGKPNYDTSPSRAGNANEATASNNAIPLKGQYNPTAAKTIGSGIEKYTTSINYKGNEYAVGSASTFGGPSDTGMTPTEGLAIDPKLRGRQLNPNDLYISARWNYAAAPVKVLRNTSVEVVNPQSGKSVTLPTNNNNPGKGIVDWGPGRESRSFDCSPGLLAAIGVSNLGTVYVRLLGANASTSSNAASTISAPANSTNVSGNFSASGSYNPSAATLAALANLPPAH